MLLRLCSNVKMGEQQQAIRQTRLGEPPSDSKPSATWHLAVVTSPLIQDVFLAKHRLFPPHLLLLVLSVSCHPQSLPTISPGGFLDEKIHISHVLCVSRLLAQDLRSHTSK